MGDGNAAGSSLSSVTFCVLGRTRAMPKVVRKITSLGSNKLYSDSPRSTADDRAVVRSSPFDLHVNSIGSSMRGNCHNVAPWSVRFLTTQ